MQASSEHSVCFAVPEKEVKAVSEALNSRFRQALAGGRLSQVPLYLSLFFERYQIAILLANQLDYYFGIYYFSQTMVSLFSFRLKSSLIVAY